MESLLTSIYLIVGGSFYGALVFLVILAVCNETLKLIWSYIDESPLRDNWLNKAFDSFFTLMYDRLGFEDDDWGEVNGGFICLVVFGGAIWPIILLFFIWMGFLKLLRVIRRLVKMAHTHSKDKTKTYNEEYGEQNEEIK